MEKSIKFKVALAYSGISMREFGRQNNVSTTAVSYVSEGERTSKRLKKAIDDFTAEKLKKLKKEL